MALGNSGLSSVNGVPGGGTTGQVLVKLSNADGDTGWAVDPSEFIPTLSVANFAALPAAASYPNKLAVVINSQGVWFVNYKPSGIYYSDGATWTVETDYTPSMAVVMTTLGDTVYGGTSGVVTRLAGNTTSSQLFLASTGDGTNATAPSWQPIPVLGTLVYYWQSTASSPTASYYQQISTPQVAQVTIANASVTNGQLLATFATDAGSPNRTFIPDGQYSAHIHAAKTAGTKSVQLRAEVWEITSAEVDVAKIADLGASTPLTSSPAEFIIAFSALKYNLASTTSRIALKVYPVVGTTGSAPDVTIYVGNGTDSRLNLPAPIIDSSNYVSYSTLGGLATGILKNTTGTGALSIASAADVNGQLLTGFSTGAGTVAATDTILQGIDKLDGNIRALLGSYTTINEATGLHAAGATAGTYTMGYQRGTIVSGASTSSISVVGIYAADFNTVTGLAPKLRIRGELNVNATAPTGTFTLALYPITITGGATSGAFIWTVGTKVTGSDTNTVSAPAANSTTAMVGSDFALPSDGQYAVCLVYTGTAAANSGTAINSQLQVHYA